MRAPSPLSRTIAASVGLGLLAGCFGPAHIRDNVSEGQLRDLKWVRKPTGEKALGLAPRYEDFLEGYIVGGICEPDGKAVGGVTVKVTDAEGRDLPEFTPGVTDAQGAYKVRFSLPVRWSRIGFSGILKCGPGWQMAVPQTQFRISLHRGILSFTPQEYWLPARNDSGKPAGKPQAPRPESAPAGKKKRSDDLFGGFDFNP